MVPERIPEMGGFLALGRDERHADPERDDRDHAEQHEELAPTAGLAAVRRDVGGGEAGGSAGESTDPLSTA